MKKGFWLIIGWIGSLLLGWMLGYLHLPYIPQNQGFAVGLLCGLTVWALIAVIRQFWFSQSKGRPMAWVAMLLVAGGLLAALWNAESNRTLRQENLTREYQLVRDSLRLHAEQQMIHARLMVSYLEGIQRTLATSPHRSLSDTTITTLARISQSFQPFPAIQADTIAAHSLSPERGQLLLALLTLHLDSGSFSRIKQAVTFAHADLHDTDLAGLDLSGADLRSASFRNADLTSVDCRDCDLRSADFTGAVANEANFTDSDMRRVVFHWTEAKGAKLQNAFLDGADLSNAVLERADLSGSMYQWGEMGGANLYQATATGVDFMKTGLREVNFTETNLTESNLRRTDLAGAKLAGAILTGVSVNLDNWIDLLDTWSVSGSGEIHHRYRVVKDTVVRYLNSEYLLVDRN